MKTLLCARFLRAVLSCVLGAVLALSACSSGGGGGDGGGGGGAPGGSSAPAPEACAAPTFTPGEGTFSSDQNIVIGTTTTGATIHYTTNGDAPTTSSPTYSAPIAIAGNGTVKTIKAIAVKDGMSNSAVSTGTFTINYSQVSTPQFSPVAGTYSSTQSVNITCGTSGATIRYTTDGSTPTSGASGHGTEGGGPISVSANMTIKAIAYKSDMTDSTVAEAGYVIKIAAPAFTPAGGTKSEDTAVTLTQGSADDIYYTIATGTVASPPSDPANPTTSSTKYTGAIMVSGHNTVAKIKAIAVKSGMGNSDVASATYTISYVQVATPLFSKSAGWYSGTQSVTLSCGTAGATVRYTTDGTTPTSGASGHGTVYSGETISVADTMTLKAIAYKTGMLDSEMASVTLYVRRVIIATAYKSGTSRYYRLTVTDNAGNVDSANWNKDFSYGNDGDPLWQVNSLAVDSQNNVYVTGPKNYDSGTELSEGFAKKYSSSGVEITTGWNKTIASGFNGMKGPYCDVDSSDNLYIAGTQDYQWVLKKYDSSGTEITAGWNKKFGHASYSNKGSCQNIRVNRSNDRVYAVGYAGWGSGTIYGWVRGFDSSGGDLAGWDKLSATPDESAARGVAFDGSSYVYIGGFANDAGHTRYASLLKYAADGTIQWSKSCFSGWFLSGFIRWMDVATDGNMYFHGIYKYSSDGSEVTSGWPQTHTNGLGCQGIDSQNNIYTAQEVHGAVYKDWRVLKYSQSGSLLWNTTISGGDVPIGDECVISIAIFR
ncbi:MAG TPA: chitobiase/beta-hexosaminidase C-terminal domain-containing protein [Spirochaetota bacterium]|nr:chitobiase/beta-hexosaminidase C-terminal domain-containing protein [Spirochaetota bacterium]